ncbi:response regulator transcription factor [Deinococcus yavapaiensis]|uniref:DNA-binding response OmpR family regulator n=1 Tax=Deinococcus yavapaiensis KR-236 TaxID=694435 RepID=A0A318SBU5_9DEIO|nr:response regulator transcription factor [Deinococcus yavapaiensis]PYE54227.1 DNA-binding response OmpR family regulator [Deinococcus yavapaiensis KR-236]
MSKRKILVIEDDMDIARFVRSDLEDAGYDVLHAADAMTGLVTVREQNPDLILLDLGLPDFDGTEVLGRVRRTSTLPIIVVTARDTPDEKVKLLEGGADDYVVKPFDSRELIARIGVQLRQSGGAPIEINGIELNVQQRMVKYHGQEVRLSPTEFNLLALLARQPGRVYSREEIEREVWDGRLPANSNVVDVHMANLRGKFRDVEGYGVIRTVRGIGYALRS